MYADRGLNGATTSEPTTPNSALRTAQVPWSDTSPVGKLCEQLGPEPLACVMLFVSPWADFDAIAAEASARYPDADVVACTTAGEITNAGYDEGMVVAIGFPADRFDSRSVLIEDINQLDPQPVIDRVTLERVALQQSSSDFQNSFAFLMVDGLSLSEDALTAALAPSLGDMPMFGGSAGDGVNFQMTLVALNGVVRKNAAILTMFRSSWRAQVFSLDHLVPSEHQMVVTEADPAQRIVKSINAEPAAREYARIVGKDPDQLDRFTFAAHPVVVRIGDAHHVRAIQQVNDDGDMVFFSAVDEGMVLTVAQAEDMVVHLERKLTELSDPAPPADIIGCDCILRRIEAEQTQMIRPLSELLSRNKVIGFSTYGEQIGPLHVNQTMSGVAFYAPDDC
jgi:hypothetical protein